jgi:hypothetical protein
MVVQRLLVAAAIAALCTASAMAGDTGACPLVPLATPSYNLDYLGKERLRASRSAALAFQAECQRQQEEKRQAALRAAARREAKVAAEAAAEVEAAEAFERQRKEAEADAARQLETAKRLAAEDAERRQRVRKHEAELRVVAEERAKHEAEEQQAAAEERQIAADERAKREADAAAIHAVERRVAADLRAKRLEAEESERRQKARKYEAELRAAAEEWAKREVVEAPAAEPTRPMPEGFLNYDNETKLADRHGWYDLSSPGLHDECARKTTGITPSDYHCYTSADYIRWRAENLEQAKAYTERRLRAEFAYLILFENNCSKGRFDSVRSKMFAEWNALSEEQRKEALDHELNILNNSIRDWRDPFSGQLITFGMKWFCEFTDKDIKDGAWNDIILHTNRGGK